MSARAQRSGPSSLGPMPRFSLDALAEPIVQAPLAGGASTPALAAAVSGAGGLGFLATGYKTPAAARAELEDLRRRTAQPFGVNLFVPSPAGGDAAEVDRYARGLSAEAERYGAQLGTPRHDDDAWDEKLALAEEARVAIVSFTFGCPDATTVERLRAAGAAVWVTVTTASEAVAAAAAGADALVVQGVEAGGHRGSFDDAAPGDVGLLVLLQLVRAAVELPLVAAGGIATGPAIAAVLAAGASAAQLGTALMLAPEAGTSAPHRAALRADAPTALTRAFSGRTARGIVNRFLREHSTGAPAAYPEIHHLTAPVRAAARERGDAEALNLWAGQAYPLSAEEAAGELVRRLGAEARAALAEAAGRYA
jgi:nitronate monooxygenase